VAWWNWSRASASESEAELARLRGRVVELEETLAFVNQKHGQLVAQEGVPMQENAQLRFDLQRCQRDRMVLEAHLASARSELRMTRAVPRAPLDPTPEVAEAALLAPLFGVLAAARPLLTDSALLATLAEQIDALSADLPAQVTRDARRLLVLRQLETSLDALEGRRDQHLRPHPQLAAGLAGLPAAWEGLHAHCVALQAALVAEEEAR